MYTFIKFAILWVFIGMVLNNVSGFVLSRIIMRVFKEDEEQTDKRVIVHTMEDGFDPDPSFWELLWNDVTWPYTIFCAIRGCRRIIRRGKERIK